MSVLEVFGLLFILLVVFFVVVLFANWFCKPTTGFTTADRFTNRAKREVEQALYKLLCGLVLAMIVVVFYAFIY